MLIATHGSDCRVALRPSCGVLSFTKTKEQDNETPCYCLSDPDRVPAARGYGLHSLCTGRESQDRGDLADKIRHRRPETRLIDSAGLDGTQRRPRRDEGVLPCGHHRNWSKCRLVILLERSPSAQ